jgi:hypothetical protein
MITLEQAKQIVSTILTQLGGNKFVAVTGAKLSYSINSQNQPVLICALPSNLHVNSKINLVHIAYNVGLDSYDVSFINTREEPTKQIIKNVRDVYSENLINLLEEHTGLYYYL